MGRTAALEIREQEICASFRLHEYHVGSSAVFDYSFPLYVVDEALVRQRLTFQRSQDASQRNLVSDVEPDLEFEVFQIILVADLFKYGTDVETADNCRCVAPAD